MTNNAAPVAAGTRINAKGFLHIHIVVRVNPDGSVIARPEGGTVKRRIAKGRYETV